MKNIPKTRIKQDKSVLTNKFIFPVLLSFIAVWITACSPPVNIRINQSFLTENKREDIVETAKNYLGTDYKRRGNSPAGFDCSGFTMYVFKKNGLSIPRNAASQYYAGKKTTLKHAKPGDLVFFMVNGNHISHVGIFLGDNDFIHAPSAGKSVSYANISNPYWRRRYAGAATYFIER